MRISDWSSDVCSSDLFAQRDQQGVFVGKLQPFQRCIERALAQRSRQARDDIVVELAAKRDLLLALLLANEAAYRSARLAADGERFPAWIGMLRLCSQALDLIAILDLFEQRPAPDVVLRAHRLIPPVG